MSNIKPLARAILILLSFVISEIHAQAPNIEWEKTFGGSEEERAKSVWQTSDGGYVIAGASISYNGDLTGTHGAEDFWVVKTDATGGLQWQVSLGGYSGDWATSVQQTTDGGYIVAGYTLSTTMDVSGNHGVVDFWVVKLSSTGSMQWQKALGGTAGDYANCIRQCSDGGFIVAGYTLSDDGDVTGLHGTLPRNDYWVVKLSATGNIEWQKTLGGSEDDMATSVEPCVDGGFVVAGYTFSNDGDVTNLHGAANTYADYWVVKLNSTGNIEWQKTLGGPSVDQAYSVKQCDDGGYIVAGYTTSNGGDVTGIHGNYQDYWVVKLNSAGSIQWQKTLGGTDDDRAFDVQQCNDGGYVVAGYANSTNGDVTGNHGGPDSWVVKLGSNGVIQWQKALGGAIDDHAYSIQQCADGGYIVAGDASSMDGDVTNPNGGSYDYWVVKLSGNSTGIERDETEVSLQAYPIPAKDELFIEALYGSEITITDIKGNLIFKTVSTGQRVSVNTTSVPNGIYFVKNKSNGFVTTKKVIIN